MRAIHRYHIVEILTSAAAGYFVLENEFGRERT